MQIPQSLLNFFFLASDFLNFYCFEAVILSITVFLSCILKYVRKLHPLSHDLNIHLEWNIFKAVTFHSRLQNW